MQKMYLFFKTMRFQKYRFYVIRVSSPCMAAGGEGLLGLFLGGVLPSFFLLLLYLALATSSIYTVSV